MKLLTYGEALALAEVKDAIPEGSRLLVVVDRRDRAIVVVACPEQGDPQWPSRS